MASRAPSCSSSKRWRRPAKYSSKLLAAVSFCDKGANSARYFQDLASIKAPDRLCGSSFCTPKSLLINYFSHFRILPLPDHCSLVTLRSFHPFFPPQPPFSPSTAPSSAPRKKQIPSSQFNDSRNAKNIIERSLHRIGY